jgi:hypothetical protein
MKKLIFLFIFFSTLAFGENECLVCHKGIENIRDRDSGMMKEILKISDKAGHKGNDCIVCHGGNPYNKSKKYGHRGTIKYFKKNDGPKSFYPKPTDTKIVKNTCGMCHQNYVKTYDTNDTNNSNLGSKKFLKYMHELSLKESAVFKDDKTKQKSHKDCATCHIPYAKDGLYAGDDVRISKKTSGHLKVHQIQSSRKVTVSVEDHNYTGTQIQNCASCHSEKKYTALSYQGLMDVKSKHHLRLQEDIHFKKGMLCQDCHTSNDLHGSGFNTSESLASVEIECQDCHGTTKKYPWELPFRFSDEYNESVATSKPRGVAKDVAKYIKQGYIATVNDGYLLSARANPLPNVVKQDDKVLVHLANGKNILLKPLKKLKKDKELSVAGLVAMDNIDSHTNNLECYTCHTKWAPQYYSDKDKKASLVRFEKPVLAQNGEGRIAPVISSENKNLTVQPHTTSNKARTCENCHSSAKVMGEGKDALKNDFTNLTKIDSDFKLASVLSEKQLDKLDRRGVCTSCHVSIPNGNLAVSAMVHISKMADIYIDNNMHKTLLNDVFYFGTFAQFIIFVFIILMTAYFIYVKLIKKKPKNPRNEGWK